MKNDSIRTSEAIARLSVALNQQTREDIKRELLLTPQCEATVPDSFAFDATPDVYNPIFLSLVYSEAKVN